MNKLFPAAAAQYAASHAAAERKDGATMAQAHDGSVLKTGTQGRYSWRAVSFVGGEAVEAIFDLPDGRCMWRNAYQVREFGPSLNDTVVDLIMERALRQFDNTRAV